MAGVRLNGHGQRYRASGDREPRDPLRGTLQRLRKPLSDMIEWAGPEHRPPYLRTCGKVARVLGQAEAAGHAIFSLG